MLLIFPINLLKPTKKLKIFLLIKIMKLNISYLKNSNFMIKTLTLN